MNRLGPVLLATGLAAFIGCQSATESDVSTESEVSVNEQPAGETASSEETTLIH